MLVKVRVHDIIAKTDKAILFLISNREVWLPIKFVRPGKGKYITCPQWLAEKNELSFSLLYHVPEKIEPVYNQKPLEDLCYR